MTQTVRVLSIAAALLLGTCGSLIAQASPRPHAPPPLGRTQAPRGLGERTRHTVGETLIRIGLGRRMELRAGIPSYVRTTTPADTVTGMGDGLLAVRRRFTDAAGWRPMVALQAGATLPIGADGVSAGEVQPEIAGYALWRLPESFQLLTMAVHRDAVAAGDRYGQSTLSAGLRRELAPGLTAQADCGLLHSTRAGARDAHQLRGGAALRIGRDLQLDAYLGRSAAGGQHETLLGLGISTRW
jgi:hypothetical protein